MEPTSPRSTLFYGCIAAAAVDAFFTCTAASSTTVVVVAFYQEQVEQKKLRGKTDIRPIFQSFSLFSKKDGVVVILSSRRFEFLRQTQILFCKQIRRQQ